MQILIMGKYQINKIANFKNINDFKDSIKSKDIKDGLILVIRGKQKDL